MASVSSEQLADYRASLIGDKVAKVAQNAVANNMLNDVALNREILQSTDLNNFSLKLDDWSVTNQKSSGRCWLFALLNLLRGSVMKKLKLSNFELSQSYVHFWDKFERANHVMEAVIEMADRDRDDRTLSFILGDPIGDGGQWNMATNLIEKYGLVPKSVFPETRSSSATAQMNMVLKDLLRTAACEIRGIKDKGGSDEDARVHKDKRLKDVFRILCIHLGTPPDAFTWQWRSKDGTYNRRPGITPKEFLAEFVDIKLEDYVCVVNDPRNEYMKTYSVDYLRGVVGGAPVMYLNVDVDIMKRLTQRQLEDGVPVWMGCDVGKQFDRSNGIWDLNLFEYSNLYGVNYGMCKADRLRFKQTMMTHAMMFTGADVDPDTSNVTRWRVENSWGDGGGVKGFYTMNDNWFDEHMFEIACPRSYLSDEMLRALDGEPVMLPAWDPMGSLA